MPMTARAMPAASAPSGSCATSERSILTASIGKALEVTQRRIAGAEIVEDDLRAEFLHLREQPAGALRVTHQRRSR